VLSPQVAALLARGADARVTNNRGLSAVHVAAALGRTALFAPLVAAGADVNQADTAEYEDGDGRRTPIMYAAHYGSVAGANRRAVSTRHTASGRLSPIH